MKYLLTTCAFLLTVIGHGNRASAQLGDRADDDEAKVWITAPDANAKPSEGDIAARKTLLDLIDRKQSPAFREHYRVIVPEASGLPSDYTILLYCKYVNWPDSARRVEVNVRAGKAMAQSVTDEGVFAGELPFAEVDELARQLALSFQSTLKTRNKDSSFIHHLGHGAHIPDVTIEIKSGNPRRPMHLKTDAWEPVYGRAIDEFSRDVRGFMHSRFHNALLTMAVDNLRPLAGDEQNRLIIAGLKKLPVDEAKEPWDYSREDLAAVEALLYSHLAVESALASALPELKRLRLDSQAKKLSLVTSSDPAADLATVIVKAERDLYDWALDHVQGKPQYAPMLVDSLAKVPPDRRNHLLEALNGQPLTVSQRTAIESLFTAEEDPFVKVSFGEFLLKLTGEDRYFDFLLKYAQQHEDASFRGRATTAVLNLARPKGKQRGDAYALLQSRLKTAEPEALPYLVPALGRLGTRADLPQLEAWADDESGFLSSQAIDALAEIDPRRAVAKVRAKLAAYLAKPTDTTVYSWTVSTHYDLLFWQNERGAVADLKRARRLLPEGDLEYFDPQPLIDYLEAPDPASRLKAAQAYVKRHRVEPAWLADVGRELLAAGADPEQCKMLMESGK